MPEWNININKEFDEFKRLFNKGKSVFLTGKAGTGKSTFIKQLISETEKNIVVLAPTGIAAVNIGGVTIHSFFKLPLQPLIPDDEHIPIITGDNRKIISQMDTLIIDEISMVRADVLDAIDCSLRKNGGDTEKPFGGKQIIFVGDIFQLEPVTPSQNGEDLILKEFYPLPCYFFDAIAYKKLNPEVVELQKVYRQTDKDYLEILNRIRVGEQTQEDLNIINQCYSQKQKAEDFTIELATTNYVADNRNFSELARLTTKQFNYEAKVEGKFDEKRFPAPYDLYLKENAQVMFVKNGVHWVNGTIAKVVKLTDENITIKLENGDEYEVEKATWENKEFRFNRTTRKVETTTVGTFTQYPLKLAWSITIHKSQGLTFEKVFLNFGNGAFAAGQAYVALSRCVSLKGLRLQTKIFNSDIIVDKRVKEFSKSNIFRISVIHPQNHKHILPIAIAIYTSFGNEILKSIYDGIFSFIDKCQKDAMASTRIELCLIKNSFIVQPFIDVKEILPTIINKIDNRAYIPIVDRLTKALSKTVNYFQSLNTILEKLITELINRIQNICSSGLYYYKPLIILFVCFLQENDRDNAHLIELKKELESACQFIVIVLDSEVHTCLTNMGFNCISVQDLKISDFLCFIDIEAPFDIESPLIEKPSLYTTTWKLNDLSDNPKT
jgi:uncharacterized protein YegL/energy-coupling factor transporter ATP-binding protein EcfA2